MPSRKSKYVVGYIISVDSSYVADYGLDKPHLRKLTYAEFKAIGHALDHCYVDEEGAYPKKGPPGCIPWN